MSQPPKIQLFGVGVTNASHKEILEYILTLVDSGENSSYIVTPNPEIVVAAQQNAELKRAINEAELAVCDGTGLFLAAGFLGRPLKARVTGTDLMDAVCKEAALSSNGSAKKPVSVGFLGAGKGVALQTAECLREKYPGLIVAFAGEEWGEEGFRAAERMKTEQPMVSPTKFPGEKHIDILFVALGFPKQEFFMSHNREKLPVNMMMGVGGAFDYLSGGVTRAPSFIRQIGLEWLYRLIRQPWRLRRQLALVSFVRLVVKERFSPSR